MTWNTGYNTKVQFQHTIPNAPPGGGAAVPSHGEAVTGACAHVHPSLFCRVLYFVFMCLYMIPLISVFRITSTVLTGTDLCVYSI